VNNGLQAKNVDSDELLPADFLCLAFGQWA